MLCCDVVCEKNKKMLITKKNISLGRSDSQGSIFGSILLICDRKLHKKNQQSLGVTQWLFLV